MKMQRAALLLGMVVALASLATAQDFKIDKAHSQAGFSVRHLMISNVHGRFDELEGTLHYDAKDVTKSSVQVTIKTASIDTDNENRDKDLRSANFFEVEKYPDITFKSTKVTPRGQDRYDVTGTLTMHGVSKEITLPVTFLGTVNTGRGEKAGFETSITLNRKDFGIVWNRVLDTGGTTLGDDVIVSINVEANKKQPPSPAPGQ